MTGFAIVQTTTGDDAEARAIAHALVEARLAACVQIMPTTSVYRWEGTIEDSNERLLSCKISREDFQAVEAAIRARHSYDVPEIVMIEIAAGHRPYLDWIGAATGRGR